MIRNVSFVYFCAVSQQHGRADLLMVFKSDDASLIMVAGRLIMTRNITLNYWWLETQRAQAQFLNHFYFVQFKFANV